METRCAHMQIHTVYIVKQRELHDAFHALQHRQKFPHIRPLLLDFRKVTELIQVDAASEN